MNTLHVEGMASSTQLNAYLASCYPAIRQVHEILREAIWNRNHKTHEDLWLIAQMSALIDEAAIEAAKRRGLYGTG